jgi:5-oxoprolinase (ATP-hydrolysing) subunit B
MSPVRILPYGERALLAEVADGSVVTMAAALAGTPGVGELVPAARTLLVPFDPALTTPDHVARAIMTASTADPAVSMQYELIVLPVRYDGPDLETVARQVGCDTGDVVRRHTGADYTVAFCGFAPGFAYLTGLDPSLHLPRLATPRTSVRAGSVGVAGEFTAAYPRSSPGGWHLLGHTDVQLWDLDRRPPALLTPGTRVRFEAE